MGVTLDNNSLSVRVTTRNNGAVAFGEDLGAANDLDWLLAAADITFPVGVG